MSVILQCVMQRSENDKHGTVGPGGGRRPLVIDPKDNRMLRDIKDSLSHVHCAKTGQTVTSTQEPVSNGPVAHGGAVSLKPEFSKSTPNLFERVNSESSVKRNGGGAGASNRNNKSVYRKDDLKIIAQSLAKFQVHNGCDSDNSETPSATSVAQQILKWNKVGRFSDKKGIVKGLCNIW